ncbi:MAG: translation initiation factor IF-2 [Minisyncoccota bacterium]
MKDSLELGEKEARPPIVALMGHIDHGKSTLLDYIRKTKITEGEAGGITQHVNAYEVMHNQSKITFIDTPGHEAFTSIRSRGANIADIAVLVVSAEDGVKPQTVEAYKHIKKSEVPFIVAITKIDKPSANIERAKQSLAENDIYVEGYGGSVSAVAVSSKTGEGINELLEMIILLSEIEHFIGDRGRWGSGIILESRLDPQIGIIAIGIIKDGTVRKGMTVASIGATAPLRFIHDALGNEQKSLSFSSPIQMAGWDNSPPVGAKFETFDDKKAAQFYAESELVKAKVKCSGKESAAQTSGDENISILPIIIKADVTGSLEALIHELNKLSHERIVLKVVQKGIGTISENDVKSAMTTAGTIVFSFNTKIDSQAAALAERSGVPIETFDIIYKLTERINELLLEREPRIEVEETTGTGKVLKIFSTTKDKHVIGIRSSSGTFEVEGLLKIIRRDEEIGRGKIKGLQQNKVEIDKINENSEFGAMIESKTEIAPGDMLEQITKVTK